MDKWISLFVVYIKVNKIICYVYIFILASFIFTMCFLATERKGNSKNIFQS